MQSRFSSRSAVVASGLIALSLLAQSDVAAAQTDRSRAPDKDPNEIVRESIYNYLIISRDGSVVRFRRMENGATVSAIDLSRPTRQVIPYTAGLFTAALVKSDPRNVVNIGLGAGAFDRLFVAGFPLARLTTVEIDPMILDTAKTFTAFQETERSSVALSDGRRYLKRHPDPWDWVVLDAYVRNSQVPPHLTTVEFYRLVSDRLRHDGVFVVNLRGGSALFQSNVKTLAASFPQVVFLNVPGSGNVIALAVKFRDRDLMSLITGAKIGDLSGAVASQVDFAALKTNFKLPNEILLRRNTKLLTDDFAPVEFLDMQPER
jgi:spermidine synthase